MAKTPISKLKDDSECYGLAKQRTGIDAEASPPKGPSPEEIAAAQKQAADNAEQMQGGQLRGAARGAAWGRPSERSQATLEKALMQEQLWE